MLSGDGRDHFGHKCQRGNSAATRRSRDSEISRSVSAGGRRKPSSLNPILRSFCINRGSVVLCGLLTPAGGKFRSHSSRPATSPETVASPWRKSTIAPGPKVDTSELRRSFPISLIALDRPRHCWGFYGSLSAKQVGTEPPAQHCACCSVWAQHHGHRGLVREVLRRPQH